MLRRVTGLLIHPSDAAVREVRRRYEALLERALDNVESGYYPQKLLFQLPVADYAKLLPRMLRDFPRAIRRAQSKNFRDLPGDVDLAAYPPYFRRNFHWQTDGYLSRRSAELYDVGVECLFLGMADVMRRQVIPPLALHLRQGRCPSGPGACSTWPAARAAPCASWRRRFWSSPTTGWT